MNQNLKNKLAPLGNKLQRIAGIALGTTLLSLPMLTLISPSIARTDESPDPAVVLPPKPVWPAPPVHVRATFFSNPPVTVIAASAPVATDISAASAVPVASAPSPAPTMQP